MEKRKVVSTAPSTSSKKGRAKVRGVSKKTYRAKYFASVRPLKKLRRMLRGASLEAAVKWAEANKVVFVLKDLAKKDNLVGARAKEALALV